ncbi:hypothetical protein GOP47_0030469 [Adiantum capillus-veneris]|nr:hypothetical protein GOP47_0030469 [Adiantum capillus-veneris]
MAFTRDKLLDDAIAFLHVALRALKSAHPVITTTSAASAQFSELHIAVREVMEESSRVERDALAATEKQAQLEQTVASQKQQIDQYRANHDNRNERYKRYKMGLKIGCKRLVVDANRSLQLHICDSDQQIALLKRQLIEEKKHTQALGAQVSVLKKELEEDRLLLNVLADEIGHLDKQLTEEKEKHLCVVCFEKPRDTLVLPCMHFHYCFSCLMQHKQANGSTCPTCRGSIQGLCMSHMRN